MGYSFETIKWISISLNFAFQGQYKQTPKFNFVLHWSHTSTTNRKLITSTKKKSNVQKRNAHKGWEYFGRLGQRWEYNIKMNLKMVRENWTGLNWLWIRSSGLVLWKHKKCRQATRLPASYQEMFYEVICFCEESVVNIQNFKPHLDSGKLSAMSHSQQCVCASRLQLWRSPRGVVFVSHSSESSTSTNGAVTNPTWRVGKRVSFKDMPWWEN
jgi:hypothetical protein